MKRWLPLFLLSTVANALEQAYELNAMQNLDGSCELLTFRPTLGHKELREIHDTYVERRHEHNPDESVDQFIQIYGKTEQAIRQRLSLECPLFSPISHSQYHLSSSHLCLENDGLFSHLKPLPSPPSLNITAIYDRGPSENRVDLVFFSDGYTASEQDKFIEDATRLAYDISGNQTFSTVRPLLNIWAAFTPSNDSGIGTDLAPKDTAFSLYRVGTELRAIYCGKKNLARAACASLGHKCDYPILLANDPYYGGLGGEFSITTSSNLNGALVLRHELGHSIIGVGEEYDGGFAYFGPNSATSLSAPLKWQPWLTNPTSANETVRAERAVSPLQAYPWTLLNLTTPYTMLFNSSGTYSSHLIRFSLSGMPYHTDLTVYMDGEDIGWEPRHDVGMDRWHYDILRGKELAVGEHNLTFALGDTAVVGKAQLCSFEIVEYGDENEFNRTDGNIAAYPTFSMWNTTTYRPTNEACLMRQVVLPHFCKPCIEGLWLALLKRVELIDLAWAHWDMNINLLIVGVFAPEFGGWRDRMQFGEGGNNHGEELEFEWSINGTILERYKDRRFFVVEREDAIGEWKVKATLYTDEMKQDPKGYLTSTSSFTIGWPCADEGCPIIEEVDVEWNDDWSIDEPDDIVDES